MSDREKLLYKSDKDPVENGNGKRRLRRAGDLRHRDLVLAHSVSSEADAEQSKARLHFLKLMRKNRLKISRSYLSQNGQTRFHMVSASFDTLCDAAEDINMYLPTVENDICASSWMDCKLKVFDDWWDQRNPFKLQRSLFKGPRVYFSDKFDKSRLDEFLNGNNPEKMFSNIQRSRLILFIMEGIQWGASSKDVGICNLIHKNVFTSVYPMHDGLCGERHELILNKRHLLHKEWATFRRICYYQPIHGVKDYFGHKIAFYFAWLGFYISWLIPAAAVGLLGFFFGGLSNLWYAPTIEVCSPTHPEQFYMCPVCDKACNYTLLKDSCTYAIISHFFDNEFTPAFAFFMSIWSVLFLKFWKRKEHTLWYDWNCTDFQEEEAVRPQYSNCAKKLLPNQITGKEEPVMSKSEQIVKIAGTWSVVVFFIFLVVGAVVGVVVYRATIFGVLATHSELRTRAKIMVAATAALMNLITINILKIVYRKLARKLTDWENPRTLTSYERSFTIKMFWFQFVNTYSSVFYVAFFKGEHFTGWPGNYLRLGPSRARVEGCSEQGCFLELCVQIIILMVGQQFLGNIMEVGIPILLKNYKIWRHGSGDQCMPVWESDFYLKDVDSLALFWEYQEVVLQYGFVTMFVAAFPLAPLVALVTNLMELRIDAINMTRHFKRPFAFKTEGIGVWHEILSAITMLAVPVNAFVLVITSEFIPRAMYRYVFSPDGTLKGYVNHSLSYFNVSDFDEAERPTGVKPPHAFCRYRGYHNSYDAPNRYAYSAVHWHVFAIRLLSAFLFSWTVSVIIKAIDILIPDMPKTVDLKIKREEYLAKEALKKYKIRIGKRRPDKKDGPDKDDSIDGASDDDNDEDDEGDDSFSESSNARYSTTKFVSNHANAVGKSNGLATPSKQPEIFPVTPSIQIQNLIGANVATETSGLDVKSKAALNKEDYSLDYLNQML